MAAISKELITAQDVVWGLGQVVQTRLSQQVLLDQINAVHIPYDTTTTVKDALDDRVSLSSGGTSKGNIIVSDGYNYRYLGFKRTSSNGNYWVETRLGGYATDDGVKYGRIETVTESGMVRVLFKENGNVAVSDAPAPSEAEDLTRKDYVDSIAIKLLDALQSHGVITQAEKAGYVVNWNLS